MIDKKQIQHASTALPGAHRLNFESSTAKGQPLRKASTTVAEDKKKKSYAGGSMLNFFKQNQHKDGGPKKDLLRSKDTAPVLFRQRKAKIA